MLRKIFFFSLTAYLIQTVLSQCIKDGYNREPIGNIPVEAALTNSLANSFGKAPLPNGLPYGPGVASVSGGRFTVTSLSTIPTSGVTVQSENLVIEGPLAVTGQLPFLGVVAMEGVLPALGNGAVQYGCGNGNVGIVKEGIEPAVAPTYNGLGAGVGFNDRGLNGFANGMVQ